MTTPISEQIAELDDQAARCRKALASFAGYHAELGRAYEFKAILENGPSNRRTRAQLAKVNREIAHAIKYKGFVEKEQAETEALLPQIEAERRRIIAEAAAGSEISFTA